MEVIKTQSIWGKESTIGSDFRDTQLHWLALSCHVLSKQMHDGPTENTCGRCLFLLMHKGSELFFQSLHLFFYFHYFLLFVRVFVECSPLPVTVGNEGL